MTEEELQIVVEQEKILVIISRLNKIFPTAQEICTQGMCIQFALLLKSIWPQGTILYDQDHAIVNFPETVTNQNN